MTPTRHILQIILFISALSAGLQSCFKRELEHEENYINIKQDPSIADNEVLRFRTFKLDIDVVLLVLQLALEAAL